MANDSHEAHANHSAKPYIFTVLALYGLTILTFELNAELSGWKRLVMGGAVQSTMAAEMRALDQLKDLLER